jgi:hypothetical protein
VPKQTDSLKYLTINLHILAYKLELYSGISQVPEPLKVEPTNLARDLERGGQQ